jgi:hypothetical protein
VPRLKQTLPFVVLSESTMLWRLGASFGSTMTAQQPVPFSSISAVSCTRSSKSGRQSEIVGWLSDHAIDASGQIHWRGPSGGCGVV